MLTQDRPEAAAPLEDLLRKMEPKLKRVLAAYSVPLEDAEDVLQSTYLALIYAWDRIRDPEHWLTGTLKRHCLMYWRGQRRRLHTAVDEVVLEWLSSPVAPDQERRELILDLERLIKRLPRRCRSLLTLRFLLGYEPAEVAEKLGYRPSSIGKITTRCLAALSRELLAEGLADETDGAGAPLGCCERPARP